MLEDLLSPSKGGMPGVNTAKAVRKRVKRLKPPGYASRVAALLTAIIAEVNSSHQLDLSPLTLQDVLAQSEEGRQLLNSAKVSVENRVLAESAILVRTTWQSTNCCYSSTTVVSLTVPNER